MMSLLKYFISGRIHDLGSLESRILMKIFED
jgi:hypothetical protein